jgi:hypothetical protein
MTPRDHNKTVSIAHGLVGALILTGLVIAAVSEARRRPSDAVERLGWILYAVPLPLLQLLTAYGVFMMRKWGRILALLFSLLYVFLFPIGTLLAIYTWWVLYGETGQRLYNPRSASRTP